MSYESQRGEVSPSGPSICCACWSQSYIREGQPVGSRTLSRDAGLQLSAATVRNVMADLEQLGFVASPHTSAGRVPTDKRLSLFRRQP